MLKIQMLKILTIKKITHDTVGIVDYFYNFNRKHPRVLQRITIKLKKKIRFRQNLNFLVSGNDIVAGITGICARLRPHTGIRPILHKKNSFVTEKFSIFILANSLAFLFICLDLFFLY